jgi:hypothetical protein
VYDHATPAGAGVTIQVANLNRNVQLQAENVTVALQRPHLMFLHNPNVELANVGVYAFGRTNKDQRINSSVVVNGVLQPGTGTNPRARYAMHFHHTGVNPYVAPAVVTGSVVVGSPGWGYVNHSSNVVMQNNVAFDVLGTGFAAEDGNEIGVMEGNLALYSTGSEDFILSRRDIHDFGHGGHGFWFQGPGVRVIDNIAANSRGGAFAYVTSSSRTMFDAINLADPALAAGKAAVPVGAVPIIQFEGNTAHTSTMGVEIWFHQTRLPSGETLIKDFTTWNISMFGVNLQYAGNVTVSNSKLIGRDNVYSGYGIMTNRLTHNVLVQNSRIEGFGIGVRAAARGTTTVFGGYFKNVVNIQIQKGQDTVRTVNIWLPHFASPPAGVLDDREVVDISLEGSYSFNDFLDRSVDSLLSTDLIRVGLASGFAARLHYKEQAPAFVPFPSSTSRGKVPTSYLDKTNAQLRAELGISYGGELLPGSAIQLPGINGYASS